VYYEKFVQRKENQHSSGVPEVPFKKDIGAGA
jgi:hypothetical protein